MEREQQLQYYISESVKQTQISVKEAEDTILSMEQQPDIAAVYCNILNSIQDDAQNEIAVNFNRYIRNNWLTMPEEVQEIVKQALIEIVQKCDSYKTLTNLAEAVATIFKASILWTCLLYTSDAADDVIDV